MTGKTAVLLFAAAALCCAGLGNTTSDSNQNKFNRKESSPMTRTCTFQPFTPPEILQNHLNLGGSAPDGGTIGVNSLYFERNGKPWIPVMGEIHFSRCKREDWPRELAKMKAGGITLVSTYLFWIHHEELEGQLDFSSNLDIRAFVQECARQGLDVVVRIGPWAHGECRNGGFPDWLLRKPFKLRSSNPEYLAAVRRWYSAVAAQLHGLFYADGGSITAIQIENEFCSSAEHLDTLRRLAVECGITPPLFTVTGWNSSAGAKIPLTGVVPVFGGYCDAPWNSTKKTLPPSPHFFFNRMRNDSAIGADLLPVSNTKDGWQLPYDRYPFATCELGGGLQSTHHRRYIIQGMDIYAISLVKLGCGNNLPGYYMYHGGTNPLGKKSTFQESKATRYPNDYPILSYDFQAPLSEYGEIRPHYRMLNLLHLFLRDFQHVFAPMPAFDSTSPVSRGDTASVRCGIRTDGHSGFVFVNHYQRRTALEDAIGVVLDAGPVKFPPIDIRGETAFFLPFHMDLAGNDLEYALAQPLCRQDNTFFFVRIPGIEPVFRFTGGEEMRPNRDKIAYLRRGSVQICVLDWNAALGIRRLDNTLYLSEDCDLYSLNEAVLPVQDGIFDGMKWDGTTFRPMKFGVMDAAKPDVRFLELKSAPFEIPPMFADELKIGGARPLVWKQILVRGSSGFVEIPGPYDAAQLYVDGKLAADQYYCGSPWRIPAAMLDGRTCHLVMSGMKDDFYREF